MKKRYPWWHWAIALIIVVVASIWFGAETGYPWWSFVIVSVLMVIGVYFLSDINAPRPFNRILYFIVVVVIVLIWNKLVGFTGNPFD